MTWKLIGSMQLKLSIKHNNNNIVDMKIVEPELLKYGYYPELFIVDSDFCTNKYK